MNNSSGFLFTFDPMIKSELVLTKTQWDNRKIEFYSNMLNLPFSRFSYISLPTCIMLFLHTLIRPKKIHYYRKNILLRLGEGFHHGRDP